MKISIIFFAVLITFNECVARNGESSNEEQTIPLSYEAKLYKHLTKHYDKWNPDRVLRPVYNTLETVKVKFGLAVIYFLEYNRDTSVGTFIFWHRYVWTDIFMKWDPSDFGGITEIRIPIDKVWKPDIVLYNNPNPNLREDERALAVISNDGTVLHIPPIRSEILCPRNDSNLVTCTMKFGSWVYDGFKVDVDFYDGYQEVDVSDYIEFKNFRLLCHSAVRNVKYYPCCAEPYIDLTFTMVFSEISSWW